MRICLLIISLLFCVQSLQAQQYDTGVGLKFGFPIGLTYKQFISDQGAIEAILGVRNGVTGTLVYEHHIEIIDYHVQFYFGGGLSGGIYVNPFDESIPEIALTGITGLEMNFDRIPITFSFDALPKLALRKGDILYLVNGGLAVRYVF